jgi:hypothetical protein
MIFPPNLDGRPGLTKDQPVVRANSGKIATEGLTMGLTFLGKETQTGNSPTLWETDDGQYVIQGFTLDAETLGQVGTVPAGEAVIRVPKKLMRHLEEARGATEV